MKKLKIGDPVIVIAGKSKGKTSTIEKIMDDYVIIKGVNEVKRATKGKGFLKKTLPIHISNVMYYLKTEKKATKIKIEIDNKGKKTRIAKATKKAV